MDEVQAERCSVARGSDRWHHGGQVQVVRHGNTASGTASIKVGPMASYRESGLAGAVARSQAGRSAGGRAHRRASVAASTQTSMHACMLASRSASASWERLRSRVRGVMPCRGVEAYRSCPASSRRGGRGAGVHLCMRHGRGARRCDHPAIPSTGDPGSAIARRRSSQDPVDFGTTAVRGVSPGACRVAARSASRRVRSRVGLQRRCRVPRWPGVRARPRLPRPRR